MTEWTRHYGCEITSHDRLWVVALNGELDGAAVPLIDAVLRAVQPGADQIAIDLHAVTFIDSAAVGALAQGPVLLRPSAVAQRLLERCGAAGNIGTVAVPVAPAQRHALVATDRDGRITDFNEAASELFGWQTWEALGRPVATVGICPSDEALADQISLAVARGETWDGEFDVLHRSGGAVRARVRELMLHDGAGRNAGLLRLCVAAPSVAGERLPQPM
ncbi:MAG TPA: PAS domain S-box protein [Solirubrobacteraceae bacterium]|nr:PAS domain S-box protein [Solirubrobacteraceae bacterium]